MTTELMIIDDLKIDKFNPYAIPGEDIFSPGIPKMGGYKTGGAELAWYDPENEPMESKEPSPSCEFPSVGDYSIDFCVKKPQVRNIQPGWAMEYDGVPGRITSAWGLTNPDAKPITLESVINYMTKNWVLMLLFALVIIYLLR